MKSRAVKSAVLCIIAALLITGCSGGQNTSDPANSSQAVTEDAVLNGADTANTETGNSASADQDASDENGGAAADPSEDSDASDNAGSSPSADSSDNQSSDNTPALSEAEIKAEYIASDEESAKLAEENTVHPIKYTGFQSKYFDTPILNEADIPVSASVTPLFSHSGMHNYVAENKDIFDLGEGKGSFELTAESYMDSFFDGKGVLAVSFTDKDGGSNYSITGAWEDTLVIDGTEYSQLVLAVKKSHGHSTTGHFLVELDTDFISLWDNITISLYE